jgi:hypothetical protein
MRNTAFPSCNNTSGERADILMQIAEQANLVRKTFQDAQPKSTVSNATVAAAAALASRNEKRKADGSPHDATLSKKQAILNSRCFHSGIAHLTIRNTIKNVSNSVTQSSVELAKVEPWKPSSCSIANSNIPVQQIQVTKNDVVCGGSKISNELIGNKRFHVWVDLHSKSFSRAPRIEDKLKIARSIVHTVQACVPSGRFLRCTGAGWVGIGYDESVQFTMQILTKEAKSHFGTVPVNPDSHPVNAVPKPKTFASMAA